MTNPNVIEFFVPGIPRPGGSKRAFVNKKTGKAILTEDGRHTKTWRADVKAAAERAYDGPLLAGPIRFDVRFLMPRPKYHYRTGRHAGDLKPSAPIWPITKPDRTKMLRSTEDALKGLIWRDDAQVVTGLPEKAYANHRPGAEIHITPLFEEGRT